MQLPQDEAMQFLVSLARAVARKGFKLLPGWSVALVEIGLETWEDYARSIGERSAVPLPSAAVDANLRAELETLVRDTPATVQQKAASAAEQATAGQPAEVQQELTNYLAQVPAMIRRLLRRPSDPSGTTLPGSLIIRTGEDLVPLLPPRPPRFRSGDRPLPGVDWVLEEMLGVGGFGEVWKASHAHLKSLPPVALKFCLDDATANMLRNEAGVIDHVMRRGRHEGIVQLRQAYLTVAPPCLEYEYVAGSDLAGFIQELHHKGKPSADAAAKIVQRLAQIIGSVHEQQPPIVHRDLKPANILVQKTPAGKFAFKISDFGIGHVTSREAILTSTRGSDGRSGLLTTRVQGSYTPLYASPQQMRGEAPDPRDDVYSLGVIWHQMVTGDLGGGAPSGMQWARELAQYGMARKQIDLLASCFETNPAHRPANAAVLGVRLRELASERPSVTVSAPGRSPSAPQHVEASPEIVAEIVPEVIPIDVPRKTKPARHASAVQDNEKQDSGHRRSPAEDSEDARTARRKARFAAWSFLIAAVANVAMITLLLALALAVSFHAGRLGEAPFVLFPAGLLGAGALFHFLASGRLDPCRSARREAERDSLPGKGFVITAIVFGFLFAVLLGFAMLGTLIDAPRGGLGLLLIAVICGAASFANGFAALRGILVLTNAVILRELCQPRASGYRAVLSRNLATAVAAALAVLFVLAFLIAVVNQRPPSFPEASQEWKK